LIEETFLRSLIEQPNEIGNLYFSKISLILHEAENIFDRENLLLEINTLDLNEEIYIIGDIHGNLQSLLKINELIKGRNPKYVIFLGDIVDRGPNQLECLVFILCLKILEPDRYYLLRGNHETVEMNNVYGFTYVFLDKFQDIDKFTEILNVYDALPICARINNKILCVHGGIPANIEAINEIKGLKLEDINESTKLSIYQMMWNDPKEEINGFIQSFRGTGIFFFGEDVFNSFLEENNLEYIIRAHECFLEGYKWFFNKHLLSIFSSENYRGADFDSPASYAIIKNNKILLKIINASKK